MQLSESAAGKHHLKPIETELWKACATAHVDSQSDPMYSVYIYKARLNAFTCNMNKIYT